VPFFIANFGRDEGSHWVKRRQIDFVNSFFDIVKIQYVSFSLTNKKLYNT